MDTKQPEALRLAHIFEHPLPPEWSDMVAATKELRRQHAENDALRAGYDAARLEIESLQARIAERDAQEYAIGAGGVEPLRKRECLHQISEPAQPVAQAQDAARYQFLRDGEWRRTDLESVIRLQLNTLWDAKIDAAIAAQQGGANG